MFRDVRAGLALALFVGGCGDSPTQEHRFDSLVIQASRSMLATGDSLVLTVLGVDANGDSVQIENGSITWSTSSPSVLSVSDKGVIRGEADGAAVISAIGAGSSSSIEFRVLQRVPSFISYRSEAGDYIGQGLSQTYQLAPGSWQDYAEPATDGGAWRVWILAGGADWWWDINIAAPSRQALEQRTYLGATRFPFQDFSEPGLDFSGSGRGCNTLEGNFTVQKLVLENDSTIALFRASLIQHCEGASAALHGEVQIFAL